MYLPTKKERLEIILLLLIGPFLKMSKGSIDYCLCYAV
jgi:hypothetical protein